MPGINISIRVKMVLYTWALTVLAVGGVAAGVILSERSRFSEERSEDANVILTTL